MRYHQKTWDLFRLTPRQSPVAHTMLDVLEREYDMTLPAAVREWYTTVGSRDLFWVYTPIPVRVSPTLDDLPELIRAAQQNAHGPYMKVAVPLDNAIGHSYTINLDEREPDPFVCQSDLYRPGQLPGRWLRTGLRYSHLHYLALWDQARGAQFIATTQLDENRLALCARLGEHYVQISEGTIDQTIADDYGVYRFEGDSVRVRLRYALGSRTRGNAAVYAQGEEVLRRAQRLVAPDPHHRWRGP